MRTGQVGPLPVEEVKRRGPESAERPCLWGVRNSELAVSSRLAARQVRYRPDRSPDDLTNIAPALRCSGTSVRRYGCARAERSLYGAAGLVRGTGMPATERLLDKLKETLGEGPTRDLVGWVNEAQAVNRSEIRELADVYLGRFDERLERRLVEMDAKPADATRPESAPGTPDPVSPRLPPTPCRRA